MIQPISNTTSLNFSGTGKIKTFLINNWVHLATQSTSFILAEKYISQINTPSDIIRRKIFIDLGETISNLSMGRKISGKYQCTNIFSNLADCAKDVYCFAKNVINKIKNK